MTIDLREYYYQWILKKVGADSCSHESLFRILFNTEFRYVLIMDQNRYQDGISLRYIFGYECGVPDSDIAVCLDNWECSVLEMIAALAIRVETDTMANSAFGDRTYIWFWDMIRSLGLIRYDDGIFDETCARKVNRALRKFMDRTYSANGSGGLVTLAHPFSDMRAVDIWTQMEWKLGEYIDQYGG